MSRSLNERGTQDILDIAIEYNTGDISATSAMESILIMLGDTFGGQALERVGPAPAELLAQALDAYLRPNGFMYDARFWSPEEWAEKGETTMGEGAELHLTYEGPLYTALNYGRGVEYAKILEIANSHGYWFELGYAWSMHFYKN
jgi:hypothetical protein